MFLVPALESNIVSISALITWRAQQLQKQVEDIDNTWWKVLELYFASLKQFEADFKNWIQDKDFSPGNLVLVWNTQIETELNQKTTPWYLGPMVVLHWIIGGSYLLAEMDGAISKLRYIAFWLSFYFSRLHIEIPVTDLTRLDNKRLDDYDAEGDIVAEEEDGEEVLAVDD